MGGVQREQSEFSSAPCSQLWALWAPRWLSLLCPPSEILVKKMRPSSKGEWVTCSFGKATSQFTSLSNRFRNCISCVQTPRQSERVNVLPEWRISILPLLTNKIWSDIQETIKFFQPRLKIFLTGKRISQPQATAAERCRYGRWLLSLPHSLQRPLQVSHQSPPLSA